MDGDGVTSQASGRSRVLVLSADGHVGPKTPEFRLYLDPAVHNDFDEFLAGHRFRWTPESDDSMFRSSTRDRFHAHPRSAGDGYACLHDPQRRVAELDLDGVAAEVLFPDDQSANTPPWLAGVAPQAFDREYPPHLRLAGACAYNRWLAEFCAAAPARLLGQILLGSLADVDAAVTEVRRAHASGLGTGVFLPLDYHLPLYHHPRYEPLWNVCDELGLAITVHASDGGPGWFGDGWRGAAIYLSEIGFYAQRPLWCFIFGGVFERHPNLKVVFTEQGSSWVPDLLRRLDGSARSAMMKWTELDPLPMLPSEFFARHCVIGNSLMTRSDVDTRDAVGVEVLAWGSDFPHLEGSWPDVPAALRVLFAGVPEPDARQMLGLNLARAYHLDIDRLSAIAARIGPRCAELGIVASPN
jgi:predicted TIM-barrel fold metal-dependent hydrolase